MRRFGRYLSFCRSQVGGAGCFIEAGRGAQISSLSSSPKLAATDTEGSDSANQGSPAECSASSPFVGIATIIIVPGYDDTALSTAALA
jgi:hypothetical protein